MFQRIQRTQKIQVRQPAQVRFRTMRTIRAQKEALQRNRAEMDRVQQVQVARTFRILLKIEKDLINQAGRRAAMLLEMDKDVINYFGC